MREEEEINYMRAHKEDGYGRVLEDVGSRLGEQTAEIIQMGLAGREHGCPDQKGVVRGGQRWVIRGLREEESEG